MLFKKGLFMGIMDSQGIFTRICWGSYMLFVFVNGMCLNGLNGDILQWLFNVVSGGVFFTEY